MRNLVLFCLIAGLVYACGNSGSNNEESAAQGSPSYTQEQEVNDKGIGAVTEVELNDPLDAAMIERGKGIYEMKCAACHKLTDQRVVGPGWEGVTDRRTPEWIMNMTINVEEMLEEDPVAREMLKECLVRMPNQNLSMEDARDVLEFMYENDGVPVGN